MEKHNDWLSSENDKKVFLMHLKICLRQNDKLKQAMKKHGEFAVKK